MRLINPRQDEVEVQQLRDRFRCRATRLSHLAIHRFKFKLYLKEVIQSSLLPSVNDQLPADIARHIGSERGYVWSSYWLKQNGLLTRIGQSAPAPIGPQGKTLRPVDNNGHKQQTEQLVEPTELDNLRQLLEIDGVI